MATTAPVDDLRGDAAREAKRAILGAAEPPCGVNGRAPLVQIEETEQTLYISSNDNNLQFVYVMEADGNMQIVKMSKIKKKDNYFSGDKRDFLLRLNCVLQIKKNKKWPVNFFTNNWTIFNFPKMF